MERSIYCDMNSNDIGLPCMMWLVKCPQCKLLRCRGQRVDGQKLNADTLQRSASEK